jgi:hypothetical protein
MALSQGPQMDGIFFDDKARVMVSILLPGEIK